MNECERTLQSFTRGYFACVLIDGSKLEDVCINPPVKHFSCIFSSGACLPSAITCAIFESFEYGASGGDTIVSTLRAYSNIHML